MLLLLVLERPDPHRSTDSDCAFRLPPGLGVSATTGYIRHDEGGQPPPEVHDEHTRTHTGKAMTCLYRRDAVEWLAIFLGQAGKANELMENTFSGISGCPSLLSRKNPYRTRRRDSFNLFGVDPECEPPSQTNRMI